MSPGALPRPGRGRMLLLVIAAHGLLVMVMVQALRTQVRISGPAPALRPLWLTLVRDLPIEAPGLVALARPPRQAAGQAPPAPRATPQPAAAAAVPQAITTGAVPMDIAAGEAPAQQASAPLDLRLPHRAAQPQPPAALARDDPGVRERLSFGERMARAMGTDNTLREEVLPDGSRRFRRGNDCVIARPSRDSDLDAFNNSAAPKPRSIGPC